MDGDKTIVRNKVRVSLYNGPFAIWTILSDRLIKNTFKLSECSCLSHHWTPKRNTGYEFYWWIHFAFENSVYTPFLLCKLLPEVEVGTTNSGKSANHPGETERFASLFYLFYSSLQTKSLTENEARQDVIIGCVERESQPRAQWQHGLIRISSLFSAAPWPRLRNAKINYLRAGQMLHTMQCTCSAALQHYGAI